MTRGRGDTLAEFVLVPLGQSLTVAAGVGVGVLATATVVTVWRSWVWWVPVLLGLAAGGVAFSLAAVRFVGDTRELLWRLESVTRVDMTGDGVVGPPREVRVEVDDGAGHLRYTDLPASREELESIADAVLRRGRDFSRRELVDAGAIEAERYGELSEALLSGGFLRYRGRSPHAGLELSRGGEALLRQFVNGRE